MNAAIPVLVFEGSEIPGEHHFELQHETTAPLFDTGPLTDVGAFRSATTDYLVDDLVVSRLREGPQTRRRSARHLDDATSDWITFQLPLSGFLRGRAGDHAIDFQPRHLGLLDLAEPFSAWSSESDVIWVGIPRSRLHSVDGRLGDHPLRTLDRSSRRGLVLEAAVFRLWQRLQTARADEGADLAAGIVETIDTALATTRAYTPSDHDLTVAMERFVATNLRHPDLTAAALQHTFRCSRATVYRVFQPHGGVATYVREQRLLRCFDELSTTGPRSRSVSGVASRWGFDNPSHFHRRFVRMFGLPPSALTRRPTFEPTGITMGAGLREDAARFMDWAVGRT